MFRLYKSLATLYLLSLNVIKCLFELYLAKTNLGLDQIAYSKMVFFKKFLKTQGKANELTRTLDADVYSVAIK